MLKPRAHRSDMWWLFCLVVISVPFGVDSWCLPFTYGSWHGWTSCTASCGGGTQTRVRYSCVLKNKDRQTRNCNEFCYNTGSYYSGSCHCPGWRNGRCCESCNDGYSISHCVYRSVSCGGNPDNVKCINCKDYFYSGGYGGGCKQCPSIANCKTRHCTNPGNTKCLHCVEDNSYFKRTHSDTKCERLCAWNNHYCWPGSCSVDGLVKNCHCAQGFDRVYNKAETSCQLSSSNTPTLGKCETWIMGPNGEMKQAQTVRSSRECKNMADFYGNFQPKLFKFDMSAHFTVNISSTFTRPKYISTEYTFGVTDATIYVNVQSVTESETNIQTRLIRKDHGSGTNAISDFFSKENLTIGNAANTLGDGEWLCIHYEAKAGGYLKSIDLRQDTLKPSSPVAYRKTVTTKKLCYRYDESSPEHCAKSNSCSFKPLHLSNRITRSPIIKVLFNGWFDPIPDKGNKNHASGIESYEITVHDVDSSSGRVKVITTGTPVFSKKVDKDVTSILLNLSSDTPKLFSISLEIKDVADNVQYARRFVLFDNSSFIETGQTMSFYVNSASQKTKYTWQTHHNDICIAWKDYFYNKDYFAKSVLNEIEPDLFGKYTGIYDQIDNPLPISGTINVHGITHFLFSWKRSNANVSDEIVVPHFKTQQHCQSFPVKDGETYIMNIRALDIVNNTFAENRTVHIDRSVPQINNLWLTNNGEKRIFVHDEVDLSTMHLYFEALDPHSGIRTVEWAFGTSNGGRELAVGHTSPSRINRNSCPVHGSKCYCPDVGECELFSYTIDLNALVRNNTHMGNHNRNYYFSVKVTNNALLSNIEHLDILVDDSPPVPGVVLEGPMNSRDIDYTSEDNFIIHWHGFIDHESGIQRYKVGVADHCLSSAEITSNSITDTIPAFAEVPFPEVSVKLSVNFTSPKMFTSVAAVNNALVISDVVCSDGITRDTLPLQLRNVTLQHAKWSETIVCHENKALLMQSNLKTLSLHQTEGCQKRCINNTSNQAITNILPKENHRHLDSEASEFLCSSLPSFTSDVITYLPHDQVYLQWDVDDALSQIEDFQVGIPNDASESASPGIIDYKSTNKRLQFHLNNIGVGSSQLFYILIKAINKAGLTSVSSIGPILVDETPPLSKNTPIINVTGTDVIVSWENDTFYDLDQKEQLNQVYFEIASNGKPVTPKMEWRLETSVNHISSQHEWSIKYPLSKLQRHDTDLGLEFYFSLFVYNNAGHFTKVETDKFKIPSKYPPGNAIIQDIDPNQLDLPSDVDVHFTASTICVKWKGFRHHEHLQFEVGVGSNREKDDVLTFLPVFNTTFHCFYSFRILSNVRYYILVRSSCTGGQTVSVSNGVVIITQTYINTNMKVHIGNDCKNEKPITHLLISRSGENTTVNASLKVGLSYYIKAPKNITLSSTNNQAILKHVFKPKTERFYLMVPVVERPVFSVQHSNSHVLLNIIECPSKIYFSNKLKDIYTFWNYQDGNLLSLEYDIILSKDNATHVNTDSPIYRNRTRDMSQVINATYMKTGDSYKVDVAPCINGHCLEHITSETFTITQPPFGTIDIAEINSGVGNNCFTVTMEWKTFSSISKMLFYQWTVSLDMMSNQALTYWTTMYGSENVMKINECVQLPFDLHKTLFGCIRGFSEDGQVHYTCKELTVTTTGVYSKNTIYDVDITLQNWKGIKSVITSSNIGDIYRSLHDFELDFGTPQSKMAGVILYGTERKIDWFLMKTPIVPAFCNISSGCILSKSSRAGFVEFKQSDLISNTLYYICANSNATHVGRELFTESLDEIRACSDGFIIDDTPPSPGNVFVMNTNGYITDLSHITITWNHFHDNINGTQLGYIADIKSYSFAIGKRPHGDDIVQFTDVGLSNIAVSKLANTSDGTIIFFSIQATDHAGWTVVSSSSALTIDTTPPVLGVLLINSQKNIKFINGDTINIQPFEFYDGESGVDFYEISIGTSPTLNDKSYTAMTSENTLELKLPENEFIDGTEYYINARAINRAGIPSNFVTKAFVVDRSIPSGGHVIDGSLDSKPDQDYQQDIHHLRVYWRGFDDIHSGLQFYRVGLGSEPYINDIEPMVDVGLSTDMQWNLSFVPGQRYYTTVEACNKAGLCTKRSSNGIVMDNSPPVKGIVKVGSTTHQKYISKSSSVHFQWYGFEDPHSDLDHFEACFGTKPESCDILPYFQCLLHSSITKTGLALPTNQIVYATVRVYNKVGMHVSQSSDAFIVDETPPVIISQPTFIINYSSIPGYLVQWEPSILRIKWQFEDQDSPVVSHTITLKTHHEGHTPVEKLELGNENNTTIALDELNWLKNGDRYYVIVTCCNAAGHCISSTSKDMLIDSSPPHLGGFKPPMTWQTKNNTVGVVHSEVTLSWYGFHDQESEIEKYYISVSRSYSGDELSSGQIAVIANQTSNSQITFIQLTDEIHRDDKIILTIWAQNKAGLNSSIARVSVYVLSMSSSSSHSEGILELEKHSCETHYCNKDCTCAVVGKPCTTTTAYNCTTFDSETLQNQTNLSALEVYGGLKEYKYKYTASSACLAGHWNIVNGVSNVSRYEWSMGLVDQPVGEGIFNLKSEIPWRDVGLRTHIVHCLSANNSLIHREQYLVYVRVWYSPELSAVFKSSPIKIDQTPPAVRRGKFIKDSDQSCSADFDYIDWMDTITACWETVFSEQESEITHYLVSLGTSPKADDEYSQTNVYLNTSIRLTNLTLSHGTKYYFTVIVYNSLGLHNSVSSDGFIVDMDKPVAGVVFNTRHHRNTAYQSSNESLSLSWHGFDDHHSGIKAYMVAILEENQVGVTSPTFINVGLHNSYTFKHQSSKHGKSYVGIVKARDAAGHESHVSLSPAVMVDQTHPNGLQCTNYIKIINENITCTKDDTYTYERQVHFTKNQLYKFTGAFDKSNTGSAVLLEVGRLVVELPLSVRFDKTSHFTYVHLPTKTDNINMRMSGTCSAKTQLSLTVSKCSDAMIVDDADVVLKQIHESEISVDTTITDEESHIQRAFIGLGTTRGGFQIKSLTQVHTSNFAAINVDVPHGTSIYSTVIVENYAGLRSVFYSRAIVMDKTPPVFTQRPIVRTNINNTTCDFELTWIVDDYESGVQQCLCALGDDENGSMELLKFLPADTNNNCHLHNVTIEHGDLLFARVICVNGRDLVTSSSSKSIRILITPPASNKATINIVPSNTEMFDHVDKNALEIIQSNLSYVQLQWSGFEDNYGIDHYEYCLHSDLSSVLDWTSAGQQTMAAINGLKLQSGVKYTAEVKALDTRHQDSEAVQCDVLLLGSAPRVTGRSLQMVTAGNEMEVDWSMVFETSHGVTYTFTVGTKYGYNDIIDSLHTDKTSYSFNIPSSTLMNPSVGELFFDLTCNYITGTQSSYKTNYKFN